MGNAGFDIIEMPWEKASFETDKAFMLEMIYYARELSLQQSIWKKPGYEPGLEYLGYALDSFEVLMKRMTIDDIDETNLNEWLSVAKKADPVNSGFPQCPKHEVILSFCGCKLCNDGR